jgi:hypothetical protein
LTGPVQIVLKLAPDQKDWEKLPSMVGVDASLLAARLRPVMSPDPSL